MRLLPPNKDLGWTPYAWLVYLMSVPFVGYQLHGSRAFWAGTVAGMVLFLGLYGAGYWLQGRKVLWSVAGITLLGLVSAPGNPGASVYFIFAAGFIASAGDTRFALRLLPLMVAVIGAEALVFQLSPYFWIPAMVFSLLIGGINIHFRQRERDHKRLLMAQEEVEHLAKVAERERIARDLHDVLGHTLSVIILKAELASKLAERDPGRAAQEIKDVERISREALAQVRATVRGYQALGLQAEAARVASLLEAAGVKVEGTLEPIVLPAAQEGVLALALREAVTNVLRHAGAKACRMSLRNVAEGCELEVRDDGNGRPDPEGAGLNGMRHRVESLGGTLRRETGSGTRLIITLPMATKGRP